MEQHLHITAMAAGLLLCSCAAQRYVRTETLQTFAPSVAPSEVEVYEKISEVPENALLIGKVEVYSIRTNDRRQVEKIVCAETAANGGNSAYLSHEESPNWRTPTSVGYGLMILSADTVSNDGMSVGTQFVDWVNAKRAAKAIPENIFFVSAGYDLWGHVLALPSGPAIFPEGRDLTVGYDRFFNDLGFGVGAMAVLHKAVFDYDGKPCRIEIADFMPRMALRYRSGRHFLWSVDFGAGYSLYREHIAETHRFQREGLAYTVGIDCGFLFFKHAAITLGSDLLGEIYDQGKHKVQHYNLRLGLNYMF